MGGMLACAFGGRNAGLCKANADSAPQALYINPARPRPGVWRWSDTMTGSETSSEGLEPRRRMAALSRALAFFGPDILTMEFPAWDCLPYDRVSPNASVVAQRMTALSRLARVKGRDKPSMLLTTVNAALQRVPAREFVATHALQRGVH